MSNVKMLIDAMKENLEQAAFLIYKENSDQLVHAKILDSLVKLSNLEALMMSNTNDETADEIKKVSRRLQLWAKRPHQINAIILNNFLKIKRSGISVITETMLKNSIDENSNFDSNFAQMKIISQKNHGKIFEVKGEIVTIWSPVKNAVDEYETLVFGITKT